MEWTEVKGRNAKQNEKREAQFSSTSTVEDKAQLKGAHKLDALAMADEAWHGWIEDKVRSMRSTDGTVCLMFYATTAGQLSFDWDASGYPSEIKAKVKALRKVSGVDADKAAVCAEEHVLVNNDGNKYILSIAYDRYGRKPACQGCRLLLQHYSIKDLARR